jgi:hypothetical protein
MTAVATHLAVRRDEIVACPTCGRHVPRRARQQRYCSERCRERDRSRSRKSALQPAKSGARYPTSRAPRNPLKKINGANLLRPEKSGSRVPPKLWREIVQVEVFGARDWRPVVSSGGVTCEVGKLRPRALVTETTRRAGVQVRGNAR